MAKYTYKYHTNLLIYSFSSSHVKTVKIDVCPEDDLQTFYPSEAEAERVGRSKLIQTNLTDPDVELFMNLTH